MVALFRTIANFFGLWQQDAAQLIDKSCGGQKEDLPPPPPPPSPRPEPAAQAQQPSPNRSCWRDDPANHKLIALFEDAISKTTKVEKLIRSWKPSAPPALDPARPLVALEEAVRLTASLEQRLRSLKPTPRKDSTRAPRFGPEQDAGQRRTTASFPRRYAKLTEDIWLTQRSGRMQAAATSAPVATPAPPAPPAPAQEPARAQATPAPAPTQAQAQAAAPAPAPVLEEGEESEQHQTATDVEADVVDFGPTDVDAEEELKVSLPPSTEVEAATNTDQAEAATINTDQVEAATINTDHDHTSSVDSEATIDAGIPIVQVVGTTTIEPSTDDTRSTVEAGMPTEDEPSADDAHTTVDAGIPAVSEPSYDYTHTTVEAGMPTMTELVDPSATTADVVTFVEETPKEASPLVSSKESDVRDGEEGTPASSEIDSTKQDERRAEEATALVVVSTQQEAPQSFEQSILTGLDTTTGNVSDHRMVTPLAQAVEHEEDVATEQVHVEDEQLDAEMAEVSAYQQQQDHTHHVFTFAVEGIAYPETMQGVETQDLVMGDDHTPSATATEPNDDGFMDLDELLETWDAIVAAEEAGDMVPELSQLDIDMPDNTPAHVAEESTQEVDTLMDVTPQEQEQPAAPAPAPAQPTQQAQPTIVERAPEAQAPAESNDETLLEGLLVDLGQDDTEHDTIQSVAQEEESEDEGPVHGGVAPQQAQYRPALPAAPVQAPLSTGRSIHQTRQIDASLWAELTKNSAAINARVSNKMKTMNRDVVRPVDMAHPSILAGHFASSSSSTPAYTRTTTTNTTTTAPAPASAPAAAPVNIIRSWQPHFPLSSWVLPNPSIWPVNSPLNPSSSQPWAPQPVADVAAPAITPRPAERTEAQITPPAEGSDPARMPTKRSREEEGDEAGDNSTGQGSKKVKSEPNAPPVEIAGQSFAIGKRKAREDDDAGGRATEDKDGRGEKKVRRPDNPLYPMPGRNPLTRIDGVAQKLDLVARWISQSLKELREHIAHPGTKCYCIEALHFRFKYTNNALKDAVWVTGGTVGQDTELRLEGERRFGGAGRELRVFVDELKAFRKLGRNDRDRKIGLMVEQAIYVSWKFDPSAPEDNQDPVGNSLDEILRDDK